MRSDLEEDLSELRTLGQNTIHRSREQNREFKVFPPMPCIEGSRF
jgi:hypothetical protein